MATRRSASSSSRPSPSACCSTSCPSRWRRVSRSRRGSSPTLMRASPCCSPTSSASRRCRAALGAGVVAVLDRVFARWDVLAADHGVEKIKTIGDAYMVAGGIPLPRTITPRRSPRWRSRCGPRSARCAAETAAARGADRHRHGAGRRRCDRPGEVHLRPLGRHREYRQPHGVPRACRAPSRSRSEP